MKKYFCVVQKCIAVLGIGKSREQAIRDARQFDFDVPDDIETNYYATAVGDMVVTPCSSRLYRYVKNHGGDIRPVWDVNEFIHPAEK